MTFSHPSLFLTENVLLMAAFCSQRALYVLSLLTLYIQLGKVYSVLCTIICHGWFCYNKIWTDGEWFTQELLAIWVTYRKKLETGMQSCNKIPNLLSSPQDAHASQPHTKVLMTNPETYKGAQSSGKQHKQRNEIPTEEGSQNSLSQLVFLIFLPIKWHTLKRYKHNQLTIEWKCCKIGNFLRTGKSPELGRFPSAFNKLFQHLLSPIS